MSTQYNIVLPKEKSFISTTQLFSSYVQFKRKCETDLAWFEELNVD